MKEDDENLEWYQELLQQHRKQYGDVPPPWVYMPGEHPASIGWRMGDGETHIMVFSIWWEKEDKSFDEKIEYFKKYPPAVSWISWMIDAIWDIETWNYTLEEFAPYLEKLKELGFQNIDAFETPL